MTISVGQRIPDATFLTLTDQGPAPVDLQEKLKGRKVVLFGLPGAFTGTCSTVHLPSFMRTRNGFAAKGVDEIICVAVNDPFVMQAWGQSTGATEAGITLLGDADSSFTKAIGMAFSAVPAGFYDRSVRYSMLVDDGVVTLLNEEPGAGICEMSTGETMLDMI